MQDNKKLMRYAINYLSKYSSSKANLERILKKKIKRLDVDKKEKFFFYNSIEEIILKLENNNLINDNNYIESKINNLIFQGKSRVFIKNYFLQKSIEINFLNKTLVKYDLENSDWELKSAKNFVRKKKLLDQQDINKNYAKMARAGFNFDIIKKALNQN